MRRIVIIRAALLFVVLFYAGLQVVVHFGNSVETEVKESKKAEIHAHQKNQLLRALQRGNHPEKNDLIRRLRSAGQKEAKQILVDLQKHKVEEEAAKFQLHKMETQQHDSVEDDKEKDQNHVLYQLEHGEDMPEPQPLGAGKEEPLTGKSIFDVEGEGTSELTLNREEHCSDPTQGHFSIDAYDGGDIFSFRPHIGDNNRRFPPPQRKGFVAEDFIPEQDVVLLDGLQQEENELFTQKNVATHTKLLSKRRTASDKPGKFEGSSYVPPGEKKKRGEGITYVVPLHRYLDRYKVPATVQSWCESTGGYFARYTALKQNVEWDRRSAAMDSSVLATPDVNFRTFFDIHFQPGKGGKVEIKFREKNRKGSPDAGRDEGVISFHGLAMRGTGVDLPWDRPITLKNLDLNHYDAGDATLGLYGIIPFVYATIQHFDGGGLETFGFFWLNGSPAHVTAHKTGGINNNGEGARLSFDGSDGGCRFFVLRGPTPKHVLSQYYRITGKPALPPLFSLGYHQCRWSYRDQRDVESVSKGFDDHDIPCDAVWLDIDHTDDKKYFTWDHYKFPNSKEMQEKLWHDSRRHMVTITDPHIKVRHGYHVWEQASKKNFFVKNEDEHSDFRGHCWPGESSWIDFTNPEARKWYATLFKYDSYTGSTCHLFSWIDMNEPSVFSGPQITMPWEKMHHGGVKHTLVHNLYGYYQSMAAHRGHLLRSNNKERPFLLTRSFFAGSQRFAAVWSGDNQAKWDHLEANVIHVLQMALSGMPFTGADVGGFFDNPDPDLAKRWYQLGSLNPFFRGHAHEATRRREPWLFSEGIARKIAEALRFRYQLLPYIYTVFEQATISISSSQSSAEYQNQASGVFQPLMMEYPHDPDALDVHTTFAVGDALIARPILKRDHDFELYVPKKPKKSSGIEDDEKANGGNALELEPESLYDFWTGRLVSSPEQMAKQTLLGKQLPMNEDDANAVLPLFVRAGKIVPLKETHAKSAELLQSVPYRLLVAPDADGYAEGTLYLDDGHSTEYLPENGQHSCTVHFRYKANTLTAFVDPAICKYNFKRGSNSNQDCEKDREYTAPTLGSVRVIDNTMLLRDGDAKSTTTTDFGKAIVIGPTEKLIEPLEGKDRIKPMTLNGGGSSKYISEITGLKLSLEQEEGNESVSQLWRLKFEKAGNIDDAVEYGLEG